jgi:small subunit ribosomal protein S2
LHQTSSTLNFPEFIGTGEDEGKESFQMTIPTMQELLEAGVHFGHKVSRGHPKMGPFVYGAREGVSIIDLAQSEQKLKEATDAIYNLGKEGKVLLVVATKKQAQEIVTDLAKEGQIPYLTQRWVGGLLTNFDEVKKNIRKLISLKDEQQKGTLSRYTKKEQLLLTRKIEKFERDLGGIANLEKVPDALFVVDAVADRTAVRESIKQGLPIIGMCDTNADPNWFDYPVPANDDGIKSIKLICQTLLDAYKEGKKAAEVKRSQDSADVNASASPVPAGEPKATKKTETKETQAEALENAQLDNLTIDETAALEEEVEKEIVEKSSRKQ